TWAPSSPPSAPAAPGFSNWKRRPSRSARARARRPGSEHGSSGLVFCAAAPSRRVETVVLEDNNQTNLRICDPPPLKKSPAHILWPGFRRGLVGNFSVDRLARLDGHHALHTSAVAGGDGEVIRAGGEVLDQVAVDRDVGDIHRLAVRTAAGGAVVHAVA